MAQYRLFLVDDDRFLLDMYAVKFKAAGHEVTAFQNGEDALKALREQPAPDALLLDIVMPNVDGFQVLTAIHDKKLNQGETPNYRLGTLHTFIVALCRVLAIIVCGNKKAAIPRPFCFVHREPNTQFL